ncbi:MAG: YceI family protein [Leadbetterella sp.]|nr:YceI family protein [Leadbetterella sp.]
MNNKLFFNYLIIIPLLFGCGKPAKEASQDHAPVSSVSTGQKYRVDTKESVVTWKGSMLMGSNGHTGYVYLSKGELTVENGQVTGGTVEVDMNTIEEETHGSDNDLVRHLKDSDFFDVKKFPTSAITITRVSSTPGEVTGNLTIKGITHSVTFPAEIEVSDSLIKASGRLVIDRTKWGVLYKSGKFYGFLADETISDSIEFQIDIVAKK